MVDLIGLNNKEENGGEAPRGVLTPLEWNKLVDAVIENQTEVSKSIKGVKFNGTVYNQADENGIIEVESREGDYIVDFNGFELTPPSVITKGEPCKVKFTIKNRVKSTGAPHIFGATAKFYWGAELVGTIDNIYDVEYNDPANPNALKIVEFDFATATTLSTSADGNRLSIVIDNGEPGETSKKTSQPFLTRVVNATLNASLSGGINNKYIFDKDNSPKLTAVMNGEDGLLYVSIDGNLVVDGESIEKGETKEYTNIFNNYNQHDIHTISTYAVPVNYPSLKATAPDFEYIYGDADNNSPLIITNISDNQEFEVYNDITLNYTAYWAGASDKNNIVINVKKGQDNVFDPITINNIVFNKNIYEGTYKISLFPQGNNNVSTIVGDLTLELILGEFKNSIPIVVKKTTDIVLKALGGWDIELLARGNDASNDTKKWSCTNGKGETYNVEFSENVEFIKGGSGFNEVAEDNNYKAMRLKKGRYFTIPYAPFAENPTWSGSLENPTSGSGKTISFEFATRNCLDLETEVIRCIDDTTGIGFKVTPNKIYLINNDPTKTLSCEFKEEERIRIDITIDGKLTHYKYNTYKGTGGKQFPGESDEALMIIYINGCYQRLALIPQGTTFQQAIPQYIKFGSDKCDLDVYNVRIYNSALHMDNIGKNYAADTPDTKEAISFMIRNDIFDNAENNTPNIDLGKLIEKARPDLPIMYFTMDPQYNDALPNNKDDWKKLTKMRWYNPHSKDTTTDGNSSWETSNGLFKNQGTSSMNYPWPWRNFDTKLDKDAAGKKGKFEIPLLGGATTNKWLQYDGMPKGIAKLTLKKDYASSEMCNNAICSELFTDMAVGIADSYPGVLSPTMRENGGATTNYRLTFKATPCFAIQILNDGKNTQNPMGMMNLIPNKNEVEYLGFVPPYEWDGNSSRAQSWECAENHVNWDTPYFTVWAANDPRTPEQGGPHNGKDNNGKFGYYGEVDAKVKDADGKYVLDENGNFTYEKVYKYLGNYCNGLDGNYEARYPKDSTIWEDTDFGFASEDDLTDVSDFDKLYNEQVDILDFHNWLVKTNRYCATDKDLTALYKEDYFGLLGDYAYEYEKETWNRNDSGQPLYTKDTKEYRKAKFENESADRLIKDQWILYYIWREQFWMFDSGSKNLQMYTMGKNPNNPKATCLQWGCMVRDADTALGINNLGVDMFPPHLEDTDCYSLNADGSIRFHYDEAANLLSAKQLPDSKNSVLNGQFGSIWLNIRDCWGKDIKKMYQDLSSNFQKTYFSADSAIERFDNHQKNWSEALYNWGMRQYFGGDPFTSQISSGNGNKKFSRKNWLEKGFYYRNSKYNNLSDYVTWRCRAYDTSDSIPLKALNIKTYMPMYIATGGSTTSMDADGFNKFRITNPSEGINVSTGATGFGFKKEDTNTYLFGSNNITDLGDLARFVKLKSEGPNDSAIKFPSEMTKLTSLRLGHHVIKDKPGHDVPYYETVNDKKVVLTNNLATNLNLNMLPALNLLDVTNHVALTTLSINKCLQLEELYASGTDRLGNLIFPQTTTLREIHLGAGLIMLDIKDLTGIKVFEWDKYYVSEAGENEKLEKPGMKKLTYLSIINCGDLLKGNKSYDIVTEAIDSLEASKKNNTAGSNSVCTIYDVNWTNVDENILVRLADINADITGNISLTSLSFENKVKLMTWCGGSIDKETDKLHITYPNRPIGELSMPDSQYIFETGKIQLSFIPKDDKGNDFVKTTWSIESNDCAEFATNKDAETGLLTVNKIGTEEDAPKYRVTVEVELNNGTKSSASSMLHFYQRKCKVGDYVFNDGSYHFELINGKTPIGVCFYIDPTNLDNRLMVALENASSGPQAWGLCKSSTSYPEYVGMDGFDDYYYDTPMVNVSKPGEGIANTEEKNNFADDVYRNGLPENDYFTKFSTDTVFGDLRLVKLSEKDNIIDSDKYSAGEYLPVGLYKTLLLLAHRNVLLGEQGMDIPADNNIEDEKTVLTDLLSTYGAGSSDVLDYLLYYPAVSYCYAYEPVASNLDNRFKKHNWWLPSAGEMARILYYLSKKEGDIAIFNKSISDRKFKEESFSDYSGNRIWTVTEMSDSKAACIKPVNGRIYSTNYAYVAKSNDSNYVRAVCRF